MYLVKKILFVGLIILLLSNCKAKKCYYNISETKKCIYDGGKKRLIIKGSVRYYITHSVIKAKVISQKKKRNGKWKRKKENLIVQTSGTLVNKYCDSMQVFSLSKGPKKRKRLTRRYYNWGGRFWIKDKGMIAGGYIDRTNISCEVIVKK